MNWNRRFLTGTEKNWLFNGGNFPTPIFYAHYYPYNIFSARDLLNTSLEIVEQWSQETTRLSESLVPRDRLLEMLTNSVPDACLIAGTPNAQSSMINIIHKELNLAEKIASLIGLSGKEIGAENDEKWFPFRKNVSPLDTFCVEEFLESVGVASQYLNDAHTQIVKTVGGYMELFCHWLFCDENKLEDVFPLRNSDTTESRRPLSLNFCLKSLRIERTINAILAKLRFSDNRVSQAMKCEAFSGQTESVPFFHLDRNPSISATSSSCTTPSSTKNDTQISFNEAHTRINAASDAMRAVSPFCYQETVNNFINALTYLHKRTPYVFFTTTSVYNDGGVAIRFVFGYWPQQNSVCGCFQVVTQS